MKNRWRDIRLVAQTVLITSAIWLVLFFLFGNRMPIAPLALGSGAPGDRQEIPAADAVGMTGASAGRPSPDRMPAGQGKRVALKPNGGSYAGVALAIPVEGVRKSDLVDTYLDARGNGERTHEAIDIMARIGTPVYAAAPGTVEKLFWSDLGGNTIYIRSPDGRRMFYYAHLDAYRDNLREGDNVRTGEPIATVGATGNANPFGPHLHFAVLNAQPSDNWSEGEPVNPYPLLAR